jgi:hypothetical protein
MPTKDYLRPENPKALEILQHPLSLKALLATELQLMPRRSGVDEDVEADAEGARRLWEVRQVLRQPPRIQLPLHQTQWNPLMRNQLRLLRFRAQFRQDYRRKQADATQAELPRKDDADPRRAHQPRKFPGAMQSRLPKRSSHPRRNSPIHLQEALVPQRGKDADAQENLRWHQDSQDLNRVFAEC